MATSSEYLIQRGNNLKMPGFIQGRPHPPRIIYLYINSPNNLSFIVLALCLFISWLSTLLYFSKTDSNPAALVIPHCNHKSPNSTLNDMSQAMSDILKFKSILIYLEPLLHTPSIKYK